MIQREGWREMEEVKKYILSQVANQTLNKEVAKKMLKELSQGNKAPSNDIAVIGMACRFPSANDPEAFWQLLKNGVNCVREFPDARFKDFESILRTPAYMEYMVGKDIKPEDVPNVHAKAGYLEEIDKFDAAFFGIPPKEATYMDPQHRQCLEVAWEAMEDAGYGGDSLKGSRTGIYIGKEGTNYSFYRHNSEADPMQLTGSWESLMVSRISHLFDFRAPCMVVDTACSAGLVSVHLAIQSLLSGDCDQVLAGGVNLSIEGEFNPQFQGGVSLKDVESEDGTIRTFDAKAKGTVWGEGVGFVLLKPVAQAIKDGDTIQAVIKASAINNDGASTSITAPRSETQESVIIDAWKKANIPPSTLTYVEAHGTGTVLGDPIELKALSNAFRQFTSKNQFCAIGSLKTNMGHLVASSGIASLIKVIKSIQHKEIAPTINFETPNPYVNFMESPVYVNDKLQPWETEGEPRRAAISSFGFSRTNCHMVVEEPTKLEQYEEQKDWYCFTISAKNRNVLKQYLEKYVTYLENAEWTLGNLCYTTNVGRGHYDHRIAILARSKEELRLKLQHLMSEEEKSGVFSGNFQIVSEKKKQLEDYEISKHRQGQLSEIANKRLLEYQNTAGIDDRYRLLEEICQLYVTGAQIEWQLYYQGERRRRIPAPVYPLERTRYWAPIKKTKVSQIGEESLHPLIEKKINETDERTIYKSIFRVDKQWVLKDHRIGSKAVLPGTSYIEMVRFAVNNQYSLRQFTVQQLTFLAPMIVDDDREVVTQLELHESQDGYRFYISSQTMDGEWIRHAEGVVKTTEAKESASSIKIEAFIENAESVIKVSIAESETGVFTFGPHWDSVRTQWKIGNESLGLLRLHDEFQDELSIYHLHPALLDNAVNLISQDTGETFLPFMYKQFNYYRPLTKEMYTHVRLKDNSKVNQEIMVYDIDLIDLEGNILASIRDYTVKRLKDLSALESGNSKHGSGLQLVWKKQQNYQIEIPKVPTSSRWGLVIHHTNRGKELLHSFAKNNIDVMPLYVSHDHDPGIKDHETYSASKVGIERLVKDAGKHDITGFIFAMDYTADYKNLLMTNIEDFRIQRKCGVDALFHLCQSIVSSKNKAIQHVKVLVRDAYAMDGLEEEIYPLSASTAGLAKVIGQEYKHLHVDILDGSTSVSMDAVVKECMVGKGYRGLRKSGVYVEELQPIRQIGQNSFEISEEGVYIITGGLGGIGLAIAEHLANKGKANIVLLGRRKLAISEDWERLSNDKSPAVRQLYKKLISLKSKLASLEYYSVNTMESEQVKQLGNDLLSKHNRINGIFHAAGVAGNGFLALKSEETFTEVLDPKLDGTMNLLQVLGNDSFLMLFSSIVSLIGGEGQGDYCAANAFLDSFSEAALRKGVHVSAANWPNWKDVGMTTEFNLGEDDSPFSFVRVEDAMNWLDYLLVNPEHRVIPSEINQKSFRNFQQNLPFLLSDGLGTNRRITTKDSQQEWKEAKINVTIKGISNPTNIQQKISETYAKILGLEEIDVFESFQDMGGNSLMTTQLLELLEQEFPGLVDISDIFSYPTVSELSEYIEGLLGESKVKDEEKTSSMVSQELEELIEKELEGTEFLDLISKELARGE